MHRGIVICAFAVVSVNVACASEDDRPEPICSTCSTGGEGNSNRASTNTSSGGSSASGETGGSDGSGGSGGDSGGSDGGGTGGVDASGGSLGQAGEASEGAGGTGTGTGAGAGGGSTGLYRDECSDSAPCANGECIEIWEGGFRTCQTEPVEADSCTGNELDDCCSSDECNEGACLSSSLFPRFGSDPPPEFNLCASNQCESDEDCPNQACLPAGVLGRPVRQCISVLCRTDSECTEFPDGRCIPVEDECGGGYNVLTCVYPPGACQRNSDCSNDMPPFEVGETLCGTGSCAEVLLGTFCD